MTFQLFLGTEYLVINTFTLAVTFSFLRLLLFHKHWLGELPPHIVIWSCPFYNKHVLISDMEIKNKAWQVAELEESKNNLLLENHQLKENVSGLHSIIQNLENSRSSSASEDASAKVCLCYLLCLKSTVNIHS